MLTDAGPELVLLYYFCCLESGGGRLCFTKRKGANRVRAVLSSSLDPCPELHIILGEREKGILYKFLTLLMSFFLKELKNSTYCAPPHHIHRKYIHLYIYFLIFNLG